MVLLANQRGAEIARERAEREAAASVVKLANSFRESKSVLVMKDGARQQLVGATSFLLSTRPVAGERSVWLAQGRTSSGVYFEQRFGPSPDGSMRATSEAQEVSAEAALADLRAQIAASGADVQAAEAFVRAARSREPAAVGR